MKNTARTAEYINADPIKTFGFEDGATMLCQRMYLENHSNLRKCIKMTINGLDRHVLIPYSMVYALHTKDFECALCGAKPKAWRIYNTSDGYRLFLIMESLGGEDYLNVDHIIPRARGGIDTPYNYQMTCSCCNKRKDDKLTDDDIKKAKDKMFARFFTGFTPIVLVKSYLQHVGNTPKEIDDHFRGLMSKNHHLAKLGLTKSLLEDTLKAFGFSISEMAHYIETEGWIKVLVKPEQHDKFAKYNNV